MLKSHRIKIITVVSIVLILYIPSIFSDFCKIDDYDMINSMSGDDINLISIFFPNYGSGLYYRPIVITSFIIDYYVNSFSAPFMHFHNILIHLLNVFLVYLIANKLIKYNSNDLSYLPFVSALMFGVHPIATESVNWISGRTDVLAGFFLFMSLYLLLSYYEKKNSICLYISLFFVFISYLTKETAIAFIPAMIVIYSFGLGDKSEICRKKKYIFLISCIAMILAFIVLRTTVFSSNSSRIGMTIKFIFVDPVHTIKVFFGAFAFYMKKIFLPWPLNFAIDEIDPLYELLSIPILIVFCRAFMNRSFISSFFIAGSLLLSPAFLIAFNQIAWTPYAERYAYISSAFIVISVVAYVCNRFKYNYHLLKVVFLFYFLTFSFTTYNRNNIWQDNFALLKDTINKSPEVSGLRLSYGIMLAERGHYDESLIQLTRGKKISRIGYDERFDLAIASVYGMQSKFNEKIKLLEYILTKTNNKSYKARNELIDVLEYKLKKTSSEIEKITLKAKIAKLTASSPLKNG